MCMRGGRWGWAFEDLCVWWSDEHGGIPQFHHWHELAFWGDKCQRKGVGGLGCICKADISNIFWIRSDQMISCQHRVSGIINVKTNANAATPPSTSFKGTPKKKLITP